VALFGSDVFDVDRVVRESLAFGPEGAPLAHRSCPHREDVNGDGRTDLVTHHRVPESGLALGDASACLTGVLEDGTPFRGCDAVHALPVCGRGFGMALVVPLILDLRRRLRR
jgi:hypothetical protein